MLCFATLVVLFHYSLCCADWSYVLEYTVEVLGRMAVYVYYSLLLHYSYRCMNVLITFMLQLVTMVLISLC